ncbi:hypothetical protein Q5752_003726 [Cryptotrichosporon argae]
MPIPVGAAIAVGLLSSFVQSLGLTVQRKSHVDDEARPVELRRRAIRRPLWIIGFAVYISSNIFGSVFQIGALPIVVLAPLGGVSLLWNSLLARLLLGEPLTRTMALGTLLVATGAVLIAVFGVVPDETHSLDELLELWKRPPFLAFLSCVITSVVGVLALSHVAVWRVRRHGRIRLKGDETPPSLPPSNYASPRDQAPIPFRPTQLRRWSSPASPLSAPRDLPDAKTVRFSLSGIAPASPTDGDGSDPDARTLVLSGLGFAAASGTLSGLCLVLAKSTVELLIITIEYWRTGKGENEFARLQTWFLAASLAVAAVLQLVYLNYSLEFASPALICPLAFCFFNLASIFDGLVYYDQFGRLAPYQIALVSIGVGILLVGVWIVSAVEPTGAGGVEVGTWAEDEALSEPDVEAADELEAGEGAELFGRAHAEPDAYDHHPSDAYAQPRALPPPIRTDLAGGQAHAVADPHTPRLAAPPSPLLRSPSLISPTRARFRRGPRYGTLIPDLAPGAPTGFAFGIGAASPGFALRSHSLSIERPGHRPRSRSDVSDIVGTLAGAAVRPQAARDTADTESGRHRLSEGYIQPGPA